MELRSYSAQGAPDKRPCSFVDLATTECADTEIAQVLGSRRESSGLEMLMVVRAGQVSVAQKERERVCQREREERDWRERGSAGGIKTALCSPLWPTMVNFGWA